jgi:hypothetical protein
MTNIGVMEDRLLDSLLSPATNNTRLFFSHRLGTVGYGSEMPKWVLICNKCKYEFEHSQVGDTGMSQLDVLVKPDLPAGATCVCPNCGHSAIYLRTDLLYRSKTNPS